LVWALVPVAVVVVGAKVLTSAGAKAPADEESGNTTGKQRSIEILK